MIEIDTPIEKLEFSQRTTKALCDFGFKTFRDIVTATQWQMLRIPNIGRKSYNEIREVLAYHNCHFDMREFKLAKDNSANEWQPIETAPKDIGAIIGSNGQWVLAMRWATNGMAWTSEYHRSAIVPTHWMPLPNPPKEGL